ncbi:hypothetical protein ACHAWF_006770 [Thalassiosira exigua]
MAIDVPDSIAPPPGDGPSSPSSPSPLSGPSSASAPDCCSSSASVVGPTPASASARFRLLRSSSSPHLPVLGLFAFYVAHDALQERTFRYPGFEYGFFITLVEVLVMLVGSALVEGEGGLPGMRLAKRSERSPRSWGRTRSTTTLAPPVLSRMALVGLLLAAAHGSGNASLNYSPYPLKVAFKSCKLVPTMALGSLVTGRKHTSPQYAAAAIMGLGLAALTAADAFDTKRRAHLDRKDGEWAEELGPFVGPILLTISSIPSCRTCKNNSCDGTG